MRLIDADTIFNNELLLVSDQAYDAVHAVIERINNAPTVDAIEVVRCKDCQHYYADPWGYGNCVFEGGVSRRTKDSDFCSWGEWKDETN